MFTMQDLAGCVFTGFTVVTYKGKNKQNRSLWECACNHCGTIRVLPQHVAKTQKSCGCLRKKWAGNLNRTHGLSKHPLYGRWVHMRLRCADPDHHAYHRYGGRGIKVCKEWDTNFEKFYKWCMDNGYQSTLQLDRRKNDKGYGPDNCRFITPRKNVLNTDYPDPRNKTGYTGVSKNRHGKYLAQITVKGICHKLGSHKTAIEAAVARDTFIKKCNLQHEYKTQVEA